MWSSRNWAKDAGTSEGAKKAAQTRAQRGGGATGVPAGAAKPSVSPKPGPKAPVAAKVPATTVTKPAAPSIAKPTVSTKATPTTAPKMKATASFADLPGVSVTSKTAATKPAAPTAPKAVAPPVTPAEPVPPKKPKKPDQPKGVLGHAAHVIHGVNRGVEGATKGIESAHKTLERIDQFVPDDAQISEDCGKPVGQWQWKPRNWAKDAVHPYTPIPVCDERVLPKPKFAFDWRGCLGLEQRSPVNSTPVLAFDRDTMRRYDQEGRLLVDQANISKATVNPYWGEEIPGFEALGLDPKQQYRLLRDPKELARPETVASFRRQPVLMKHKPSSADDHPVELTVGTTGDNVRYEHPYLKASLAFWPRHAIDAIESNKQKELSSSYHYDPVMEPGMYTDENGVKHRYDGRMTNIRANHIALVPEGRAGADVCVSDSAFKPRYRWGAS